MENTLKKTPKKTSKTSYLELFDKLNKSPVDETFELRAASGSELYADHPESTALIANDESRETLRQTAVLLIQDAIENEFCNHGLGMIPIEELFSLLKNKSGVTLQSPLTFGNFNKLEPVVQSFIAVGDGFQKYQALLASNANALTDPHRVAYRHGQVQSMEIPQAIKEIKSSFHCLDAMKLYAAMGAAHENNTQACQQLGALDVYIRQEVDRLHSPSLDKSWSEFASLCEIQGGKHEKLAQYHGSPTSELSLPISLLGAYGESFVEGGMYSVVNRLNQEIIAGKKKEFTEFSPYFNKLEELKRNYSTFQVVASLDFLKGKSHRVIVKKIRNYERNLMLLLHAKKHTMAAGFTRYSGIHNYWFLDPSNGLASFSTAKGLIGFLDNYFETDRRYDRYGMKKRADGFQIDSVDVLTKANSNFGNRKSEFIDMLGLASPSSQNPSVATTTSPSATESGLTSRPDQTTTPAKAPNQDDRQATFSSSTADFVDQK